jgi:hypothetical protein
LVAAVRDPKSPEAADAGSPVVIRAAASEILTEKAL